MIKPREGRREGKEDLKANETNRKIMVNLNRKNTWQI